MGALASASAARNRHLIAAVLSTDVEIVVDSGGAIPMRPSTARGRPAAAELILQILSCFPRPFLTEHEINGEPGLLLKDGDVLVGIMSAAVTRDAISEVWVVLNPQKLIRFEAG
jgi:RNA polymerase sigma-70 factor (ECF subfamily)